MEEYGLVTYFYLNYMDVAKDGLNFLSFIIKSLLVMLFCNLF